MQFEDWRVLYRFQKAHYGPFRGFLRSFRQDLQRRTSRALLQKHILPHHRGLELGAGESTISPVRQTLLTDAYASHAGSASLATEFFPAEKIPYPDQTFDFIINEHVLEHLPDPISALKEWRRVLKPEGYLFLFLPHPERTFDRYRKVTSLEHLFEDHETKAAPVEDYHWEEWSREVIARGLAPHYATYNKSDSLQGNLIHRHVFIPTTVAELLRRLNWQIIHQIDLVPDRTDSFAVVARNCL